MWPKTDATKGQALRQPGGAEEDSSFCESDRHLCLAYNKDDEEHLI